MTILRPYHRIYFQQTLPCLRDRCWQNGFDFFMIESQISPFLFLCTIHSISPLKPGAPIHLLRPGSRNFWVNIFRDNVDSSSYQLSYPPPSPPPGLARIMRCWHRDWYLESGNALFVRKGLPITPGVIIFNFATFTAGKWTAAGSYFSAVWGP